MKVFLSSYLGASKSQRTPQFTEAFFDSEYILETFYNLRSTSNAECLPLFLNFKGDFILDSGAFTFMNNKGTKIRNFERYLEEYIDFINKYDIKYFFELDVDSIVGYDEVLRMREKLENGTNKKCIPVWHISRGLEEYVKMCQEYDYASVGGDSNQGN